MSGVQTVLGGAGVALAMGLMLGGAMRPDLASDDRPAGPQTILGTAATRALGPMATAPTLASYSGGVPDYVHDALPIRTGHQSSKRTCQRAVLPHVT